GPCRKLLPRSQSDRSRSRVAGASAGWLPRVHAEGNARHAGAPRQTGRSEREHAGGAVSLMHRLLCLLPLILALCGAVLVAPFVAHGQDAGAMTRLLKSGRLPPDRIGSVLKLACERGNEQDLAYVYEQATKPDGFTTELRRQALEGLATAAQTRK